MSMRGALVSLYANSSAESESSRESLLGLRQVLPCRGLACGNGTIRTPHPAELFGTDWVQWMESRHNRRRKL